MQIILFQLAEANHTISKANKNITIQITDYDENNPVVGPELYIRFSRVGFGQGSLSWGSDNVTQLITLESEDFTAGVAIVNVSIDGDTTPVGYNWILQIVGVNGSVYNDSEHAYMNYVIDVTENILSTGSFNKSKLDAFYNAYIYIYIYIYIYTVVIT